MKTLIIAEAGVNHNGDMKIARRLIDAAFDAGADAIKFQTFKADKLVSRTAPMAEYQKNTTGRNVTQYEMIKKLELDINAHEELAGYCREKGIEFLSTAFDLESIDLLVGLGLSKFKVPSGEITNLPYLRKIGGLEKDIILSTGMSDLSEVEDALNVLQGAGTSINNIIVLHCNTEYPTPFEDVNLLAMISIREAFKVKVGYSDHTPGIEVSVAAVAMGATVIEKHLTLDRKMEGPDHKASLEPDELRSMVKAIRNIEIAMGDGVKKPSASELKNKEVARKSIVASMNIRKGELLSEDMLTTKRPGSGISPMEWDNVVGQTASRDIKADELIEI